MELKKNKIFKSPENSLIKDQHFSIDLDGKTLQFYNHKGEEKVFEINHYGEGNTIFFKKNDQRNKSKSYS